MKKIAISIGDLNGVGLEIALRAHEEISKICTPMYCINESMLLQGAKKLSLHVPHDFTTISCMKSFEIANGEATKQSGKASYDSFIKAFSLTKMGYTDAMVTLPINKKAWEMAGVKYKGHTDALSDLLDEKAIMMLGCEKLFVALFTHHIPLNEVSLKINSVKLEEFMLRFYEAVSVPKIGVLGLNPHAGDNGVIGNEEIEIQKAIDNANIIAKKEVFVGPLVPDTAFSRQNLQNLQYFICMYHDQGLAPLKALYFEESINVSLNLSILRASVDHGTAYDKAYKNANLSLKSYINAIKYTTKDKN